MKADLAVILAAGRGERMNSAAPAALRRVCGQSLARWALETAAVCSAGLPLIVQGPGGEIEAQLGASARYAVQETPLGTAHALRCAMDCVGSVPGLVLVLHANLPLLTGESCQALVEAASISGAAALVYRGGQAGGAAYAGAWCFTGKTLERAWEHCEKCASLNELADALPLCGVDVREVCVDPALCPAAFDGQSLAACEAAMRRRILQKHFSNGVTFIDPASVEIGPAVEIGRDAEISPCVSLLGTTKIGAGSRIKNGCVLTDTLVGCGCELSYVVAHTAQIGDDVKIGPFVNLRPGTRIAQGVKIGDFVEIKNSVIGRGSKLPHLSYIGDADVGERVNVGCGAVFVNYDGFEKHRTVVGNDVFLGCQTNLIAPVQVGDDAYTAAGSTITRDVPAGAMAFARARQENKPGYVARFRALKGKE